MKVDFIKTVGLLFRFTCIFCSISLSDIVYNNSAEVHSRDFPENDLMECSGSFCVVSLGKLPRLIRIGQSTFAVYRRSIKQTYDPVGPA